MDLPRSVPTSPRLTEPSSSLRLVVSLLPPISIAPPLPFSDSSCFPVVGYKQAFTHVARVTSHLTTTTAIHPNSQPGCPCKAGNMQAYTSTATAM